MLKSASIGHLGGVPAWIEVNTSRFSGEVCVAEMNGSVIETFTAGESYRMASFSDGDVFRVRLAADVNGDGKVNMEDFCILAGGWMYSWD